MYSDDDTPRRVGCPIRISTDQSLLAAPRGFSQRATSFIASWCQGIHRMPFSCSSSFSPPHRTRIPHRTRTPQARPRPTLHSSQPHPNRSPHGYRPGCAAPPHGRHEPSAHTRNRTDITTGTAANVPERIHPRHRQLTPPRGRRNCRSDNATGARPATHQNLIHPDKDHIAKRLGIPPGMPPAPPAPNPTGPDNRQHQCRSPP